MFSINEVIELDNSKKYIIVNCLEEDEKKYYYINRINDEETKSLNEFKVITIVSENGFNFVKYVTGTKENELKDKFKN